LPLFLQLSFAITCPVLIVETAGYVTLMVDPVEEPVIVPMVMVDQFNRPLHVLEDEYWLVLPLFTFVGPKTDSC
jgi:hypothetical protein